MTAPAPPLARILTRRLAWIALAALAINALVVGVYYGSDRQALEEEAIERVMARLEAALAGAPPRVDASAREIFARHPGAYAFALVDRTGAVLDAENPALVPAEALETGAFADDWVARVASDRGRTVVAAHAVASGDDLRLVLVMSGGDPAGLLRSALLAELVGHIWLPIVPVVLILIGANAVLVRRGLAPVAAAAAWARAVRPGSPAPPPPRERVPAEIADLVDATQRSLDRLNAALAAEKRRAAEAAHALRTPVAVLVARLDALPPGETADRLRADLSALSRTVRQVLASASADALAVDEAATVDLGPVAEVVTANLAAFAHGKGVALALERPAAPVLARGDADGVALALSNLVENAIVHGGPGAVEIVVGPGPEIRVRDHGPGVPPGGRGNLFEPFWRGENAPPGGAGLGLAIVERVQRAQGGSAEVASAEGGGAAFVLRFRSADR
ncbi:sensor histidine kinase [Salinarimonas sp. NSM]|uniref:sensor histidine kinase n=1 Tax=Salinarimonas sp. NSM TaxID=3458003 RepID=UPI0040370DA9